MAREPSTATVTPLDDAAVADSRAMSHMARGDQAALAELYDRHATAVYSLALRIVSHPADAEDVTQQVFTQAWRTSARYDASRGVVAAWLLMMARSRAIDCLRKRSSSPMTLTEDGQLAEIVDPDPSVERLVATREQVERVQAAMARLPEDQRVAVELAYYEGLTQTEIAAKTSTPLGTVKTRVRSALQTLRAAMAARQTAGGGAP